MTNTKETKEQVRWWRKQMVGLTGNNQSHVYRARVRPWLAKARFSWGPIRLKSGLNVYYWRVQVQIQMDPEPSTEPVP